MYEDVRLKCEDCKKEVRTAIDRRERLLRADLLGVQYDGVRIASGPSDRVGNAAADAADLGPVIGMYNDFIDKREWFMKHVLPDMRRSKDKYTMIYVKCFVDGMSAEAAGRYIGYSRGQVFRLLREMKEAIQDRESLLPS